VVLRGLGGTGSALFSVGLMSYLLAVVPRERMGRAMGTFNGAFLLGAAFGPTVGGLAADALGLRGPFFLYALFCAAAGVVALLVLRQPPGSAGRGPVGRAPGQPNAAAPKTAPLRPSRLLAAALSSGFAQWWLLGGFRFSLVPLYATERLGLDSGAIGLGLTASALANLCVVWPAGLAADRFGRRAVGIPGFVGLALAAGTFMLADGLLGYILASVLLGAVGGAASVVPGALLADATPANRAGAASGIGHLGNDLGNMLGPVAVGLVLDAAGYPMATLLAILPALCAAGLIAGARPRAALLESAGRGRSMAE
jgi:MFS family permease